MYEQLQIMIKLRHAERLPDAETVQLLGNAKVEIFARACQRLHIK